MKRRIGILTSGGDCPGLNACIRGVARASYSMFDTEIVGIQDGYAGLIAGDYKEMKQSDFSGILTLGGTILGTRRTPFRNMRVIEEDNIDKVKAMNIATYTLVGIGGAMAVSGAVLAILNALSDRERVEVTSDVNAYAASSVDGVSLGFSMNF